MFAFGAVCLSDDPLKKNQKDYKTTIMAYVLENRFVSIFFFIVFCVFLFLIRRLFQMDKRGVVLFVLDGRSFVPYRDIPVADEMHSIQIVGDLLIVLVKHGYVTCNLADASSQPVLVTSEQPSLIAPASVEQDEVFLLNSPSAMDRRCISTDKGLTSGCSIPKAIQWYDSLIPYLCTLISFIFLLSLVFSSSFLVISSLVSLFFCSLCLFVTHF